jgi:hypothetical protein
MGSAWQSTVKLRLAMRSCLIPETFFVLKMVAKRAVHILDCSICQGA